MHAQSQHRGRAGIHALAFAVLVGMTMAAGSASAQPINGRAPWCATFSQYGGTLDCAYYSLEQCMASASGMSNQCSRNPWYVEERPGYGPRPRPPRDWRW